MGYQVSIEGSYITKTKYGNYTKPEILLMQNRHESNIEFGSTVIAEIINEAKKTNPKINTYIIRIADITNDHECDKQND